MTLASKRFAAAILLVGCASRSPERPPLPPYTGPLDFPTGGVADFFDQQKIVATYEGHSFGFDAVLQKRGNELTLLGLTPFGSRAFIVTQKGVDVSFQNYVGASLPFRPQYMLIDVHRVFLQTGPPGDAAPYEGGRTFSSADENVTERWHDGRLVQRSYARIDGRPPGAIVVDYEGGVGDDARPPHHVVLTNGWYGYRLDITTLSHKPL
jgi:uncharacterized protein DUF3261